MIVIRSVICATTFKIFLLTTRVRGEQTECTVCTVHDVWWNERLHGSVESRPPDVELQGRLSCLRIWVMSHTMESSHRQSLGHLKIQEASRLHYRFRSAHRPWASFRWSQEVRLDLRYHGKNVCQTWTVQGCFFVTDKTSIKRKNTCIH
jgi:hypothetical protein